MDREFLMDETIEFMLQKLDPHSYYITAADIQAMSEPLEGSFEGIGVQFSIQKDTIVVIDPISGGPSEKVGLKAGDRIVEVDSELVAGVGITNAKVMKLLKGPGGTEVTVGVVRDAKSQVFDFNIIRDKIPIYSVDVGYMIEPDIGYIKVSRFAKTTADEFVQESSKLLNQGMQKLILDLRGNGGGFMDAAIQMADEFLSDGKLIVYTEGRARSKEEYHATSDGQLQNVDVVVLIDEGSASASEIVAGALQDNDRGTIVGRRSFGKGLVQEQNSWPDGSATRLTIARYYTPTGRCIQRSYKNGTKAYHDQIRVRFENGELEDSSRIELEDSIPFTTPGGKTVYGGGGIMPDVFVPLDTSGASFYLSKLYYKGLFYQFSFDYSDHNRENLLSFGDVDRFIDEFTVKGGVEEEFYEFAKSKGIEKDERGIENSRNQILYRLKAGIGRNIYGSMGYYPVLNSEDSAVTKALSSFGKL
tara:strand:+ start:8069 stop:9490 length:1422 start_codon:yes stop_codon:yes gene_type:complete